ncbi:MAG: GTP pyrophosphokinase [Culicoidibacterales bacterium]
MLEKELKAWPKLLAYYQMAAEELESDLKIIDMDWKIRLGYSPIEHLKVRIKSIDSIQKKLDKKGYSANFENVKLHVLDLVGARIITSFEEDVYLILAHLQERDDYRILKVKDYIVHPKPSGYRSLHVIAEIEVVLHHETVWIPIEIQVRTLAMDFWAATEHKLQYKYPKGNIPEAAMIGLQQIATTSQKLDQGMSLIRQEIIQRTQEEEQE